MLFVEKSSDTNKAIYLNPNENFDFLKSIFFITPTLFKIDTVMCQEE